MTAGALSAMFFDEVHAFPDEATSGEPALRCESPTAGMITTSAMGHLIAILESICARELALHLDPAEDAIVASQVECHYRAPIAGGTPLRFTGWLERIGDDSVQFRVFGQDEQARVCEGRIRLEIGRGSRVASCVVAQAQRARAATNLRHRVSAQLGSGATSIHPI